MHTAAPMWMSSGGVVTADDIEHATGLELAELEKAVKGEDLFTDSDAVWLNSVRAAAWDKVGASWAGRQSELSLLRPTKLGFSERSVSFRGFERFQRFSLTHE